jgi:hypothetical protein
MALVTTLGGRTVPMVNTMGTAPPSRRAPAAPAIQGYSGANPVRAFQGMAAATPQSSGAMSIGQLMNGMQPVPQPQRYPIEFVNPSQYQDPATKASVSFLPGLSDSIGKRVDSRPVITPTAPPLTTPVGGGSPTISQAQSPASQVPSALIPTSSPVSQVPSSLVPSSSSSGVTSVGRSIQTNGANHTISPKSGTSALAGNSLAGATSPTAQKAIPNFTTPAADSSQKTSGFTAYNAADPNRALKMMRGY